MEELKILCLGSGSTGNCYLLGKGDEYIMVECGLEYKTIISKLDDYNIGIDQIKACVVSHSHKDHSLSIEDLEALEIPIFAPYKAPEVEFATKPIELTKWAKVRAFKVSHDVDCYGFAFLTSDKESILFVTDTRYIESLYFKYKYNYR